MTLAVQVMGRGVTVSGSGTLDVVVFRLEVEPEVDRDQVQSIFDVARDMVMHGFAEDARVALRELGPGVLPTQIEELFKFVVQHQEQVTVSGAYAANAAME